MKRLVILLVAAAALWSGFWYVQARATRVLVESWVEAQRADGWTASYSDLAVRGFPNRIDVTFEDLELADPESGIAWQAPFFQVFRLVYNPSHFIFAWPESQSVTTPSGTYDVQSEGLRASLRLREGDVIDRLHAEAESLSVEGEGQRADLTALTAAFDAIGDSGTLYRLGVAARDGRNADRDIAIRAEIDMTEPPSLSGETRIASIDLDTAEYAWDAAALEVSGEVDVDNDGQLSGDVELAAREWQTLLDDAVERGRVPGEVAETVRGALSVVARLRGDGDTLDVGLRLEDGTAYLGPIAVGEVPRLPF